MEVPVSIESQAPYIQAVSLLGLYLKSTSIGHLYSHIHHSAALRTRLEPTQVPVTILIIYLIIWGTPREQWCDGQDAKLISGLIQWWILSWVVCWGWAYLVKWVTGRVSLKVIRCPWSLSGSFPPLWFLAAMKWKDWICHPFLKWVNWTETMSQNRSFFSKSLCVKHFVAASENWLT